jgi:hypothetical protein
LYCRQCRCCCYVESYADFLLRTAKKTASPLKNSVIFVKVTLRLPFVIS